MPRPVEPRTAVVTGATGQDGYYLVRRLLADGWTVHAAVRDVEAAEAMFGRHANLRAVRRDLRDPGPLCALVGGRQAGGALQPRRREQRRRVVRRSARDLGPWLTNTIVLPSSRKRSNVAKHFSWNAWSPTASTSSSSRMSKATWIAIEYASRTCIPDE